MNAGSIIVLICRVKMAAPARTRELDMCKYTMTFFQSTINNSQISRQSVNYHLQNYNISNTMNLLPEVDLILFMFPSNPTLYFMY